MSCRVRAAHGMQMAGNPDDEKNYNLFLLSKTKWRRAFLFPPSLLLSFFLLFPSVSTSSKGKVPGWGRGEDSQRSFNQLILFLYIQHVLYRAFTSIKFLYKSLGTQDPYIISAMGVGLLYGILRAHRFEFYLFDQLKFNYDKISYPRRPPADMLLMKAFVSL